MYRIKVSNTIDLSDIYTEFVIDKEKAKVSTTIKNMLDVVNDSEDDIIIVVDERVFESFVEYWYKFADPKLSIKHVLYSEMKENQIFYESLKDFPLQKQEYFYEMTRIRDISKLPYVLETLLLLLQAANYCGLEVFSAELTIAIHENIISKYNSKEIYTACELDTKVSDEEFADVDDKVDAQQWIMDACKDIRNIVMVLETL